MLLVLMLPIAGPGVTFIEAATSALALEIIGVSVAAMFTEFTGPVAGKARHAR